MKVLSVKHPGLWFICERCGAVVIDVQDNEIYNERDVYCPICHALNEILFDKNYDGIVKERKET